jgi:hypothetical protein
VTICPEYISYIGSDVMEGGSNNLTRKAEAVGGGEVLSTKFLS